MDTSTARRTAENAVRDVTGSRAAMVDEVGVTQAGRDRLADDVTSAADPPSINAPAGTTNAAVDDPEVSA